jgi:iron-sulfur cluster insertion protein
MTDTQSESSQDAANFDDPFAVTIGDSVRELGISESAAKRLIFLLSQEDDQDQMLRVTVSGGGCSGYQYEFGFSKDVGTDDMVFSRDGVKVVTDNASMDLLAGSQLDYVDDLIGAFFTVNNPNASSSCGCGVSFSV